MRLFVYEPGPPGHISAEFAKRDGHWRELEGRRLSGHAEAGTPPMSEHARILPRDQVPTEALAAWEAGDDSAYESANQETLIAQSAAWRRHPVGVRCCSIGSRSSVIRVSTRSGASSSSSCVTDR